MKLINNVVKKIIAIGKKESKKTAFLIGNTIKIEDGKFYLTPVRNYTQVVLSGVIVYSEEIAKKIAKEVDGLVDYIFVDAEKKISDNHSITGEPGNIERAVKEVINKSVFISYKSNDLTVDAADAFISEYFSKDIRHIGGKKIAIIGVGNMGSKLGQKLVERGANVSLYRRNRDKLNLIVKQINTTKSKYTVAQASSALSVNEACKDADILIGVTDGIPVIDDSIVEKSSKNILLIDIGKGSISADAIKTAHSRNIKVFRLSIESALEGMVTSLISTHNILKKRTGRGEYHKINVVSGGLLARSDEIVVDDYIKPKLIYGVGNGYGDFMRNPNKQMKKKINSLKKIILDENINI